MIDATKTAKLQQANAEYRRRNKPGQIMLRELHDPNFSCCERTTRRAEHVKSAGHIARLFGIDAAEFYRYLKIPKL